MNFFAIRYLIIVLYSSTPDVSSLFFSRTKLSTVAMSSKDCCLPAKVNVNSQKANLGKDFLRQLTIRSDTYEEATPDNMCHLIHFLFQQASMNHKPADVTDEMFILFDSSTQVFDRIISSKKNQTNLNEFNFRQSLHPSRYIGRRAINTVLSKKMQSSTYANDQYPTYGMDIPKSCLPHSFDHLLFGELPSLPQDPNAKRMFIKPDRFGFEKTRISSALDDVNSFVKQRVKQRFCRLIRGDSKAQCAKIRALKDNRDKKLLKKWIKILSNLPSKWNVDKQYRKRAMNYGIYEMDRQAKDLEAIGAGRDVKNFRKILIQKYGQDDLGKRQGREIVFTIPELKQSRTICEAYNETKRC